MSAEQPLVPERVAQRRDTSGAAEQLDEMSRAHTGLALEFADPARFDHQKVATNCASGGAGRCRITRTDRKI
jgi:hypothetical protein